MNSTQDIPLNTGILKLLDSPAKICIVALTIGLGYLARKRVGDLLSRRAGKPYPPGPPRDFLIGTLRSFPKGQFTEHFCEWARTYGIPLLGPSRGRDTNTYAGEIVYAPLPGMNIIILNSYEITQDFLGKRPSLTAGRYTGYFVLEL
jgi:hypothetical protein